MQIVVSCVEVEVRTLVGFDEESCLTEKLNITFRHHGHMLNVFFY